MKNIIGSYFNKVNNKVNEDDLYYHYKMHEIFQPWLKVHEINNISDSLWAFDIIKSI